jgi:hypothetical protein
MVPTRFAFVTLEGFVQSRRAVRLALVLALLPASLGIAGGVSAAGVTGTVRLDPSTTQVDNGATFSINVISHTTVPISGVSASITFNKSVLQVTTITRAPAWASAALFLAGDAPAIATANQKGVLKNVAASFFPPGSVPAGDQQFITVGFKAVACGTVTMTVPISKNQTDATMVDGRAAAYGAAIKITTTGATVTVCQGGAGASQSAGPGASGSTDPGVSSSPGASDSFDPNASASTDPAPGESLQPGGTGTTPSAGPSMAPGPGDNGSGGTTAEQSSWLTFAMAALAVAAAGLAALILVLTVTAIVAAAVGGMVVIRVWRRYSDSGTPPEKDVETTQATSEPPGPGGPSAGSGVTPPANGETPAVDAAGVTPPTPAIAPGPGDPPAGR